MYKKGIKKTQIKSTETTKWQHSYSGARCSPWYPLHPSDLPDPPPDIIFRKQYQLTFFKTGNTIRHIVFTLKVNFSAILFNPHTLLLLSKARSSLHWSFDCFLCRFSTNGVYSEYKHHLQPSIVYSLLLRITSSRLTRERIENHLWIVVIVSKTNLLTWIDESQSYFGQQSLAVVSMSLQLAKDSRDGPQSWMAQITY